MGRERLSSSLALRVHLSPPSLKRPLDRCLPLPFNASGRTIEVPPPSLLDAPGDFVEYASSPPLAGIFSVLHAEKTFPPPLPLRNIAALKKGTSSPAGFLFEVWTTFPFLSGSKSIFLFPLPLR